MSKSTLIAAACAALIPTSAAQADPIFDAAYKAFIWSEDQPHTWTHWGTNIEGAGMVPQFTRAGETLKVKLSMFPPSRTVLPGEELYLEGVSAVDSLNGNRPLTGFPSRLKCEIDAEEPGQQFISCYGEYVTTAADVGRDFRPVFYYTTNGPRGPLQAFNYAHFVDVQILNSFNGRLELKEGEAVEGVPRIQSNYAYSRLAFDGSLPDGIIATGIGSPSILIRGTANFSGSVPLRVIDLESEKDVTVTFDAEAKTPDPVDPETPETPTACNRPMTPPAGGAKFVFRFPIKSVACS